MSDLIEKITELVEENKRLKAKLYKFVTHNDEAIDADGTHLQGGVDVSYDRLVEVFGQPEKGDEYKVDAEWRIKFKATGDIATIYNYKNGKSYRGDEGLDVHDITDWNIGGHSYDVVEMIESLL